MLSGQLAEWHDAMVAHERHLGTANGPAVCGEDCPHGQARDLWLATHEGLLHIPGVGATMPEHGKHRPTPERTPEELTV